MTSTSPRRYKPDESKMMTTPPAINRVISTQSIADLPADFAFELPSESVAWLSVGSDIAGFDRPRGRDLIAEAGALDIQIRKKDVM